MAENFLPPNVDNVVCDIVACFRMLVAKLEGVERWPFANDHARTIIVREAQFEQYKRHLEEFDSIVGLPRDPMKTQPPQEKTG